MNGQRASLAMVFGLLGIAAGVLTGRADAVGLSPMGHTTLTTMAGSISDSGFQTEYSRSFTGPTDFIYEMEFAGTSDAGGIVMAIGEAAGPGTDLILFGWQSPNPKGFTSISGAGSFRATFSSAVTFHDFGATYGYLGTVFVSGGQAVSDGRLFDAGTYTFRWTNTYLGSAKGDFIVGAVFTAASATGGGAVPLPGSAAAAVVGLAAMRFGRRRR